MFPLMAAAQYLEPDGAFVEEGGGGGGFCPSVCRLKQTEASDSAINARYRLACDKTIKSLVDTERNTVHFSLKI